MKTMDDLPEEDKYFYRLFKLMLEDNGFQEPTGRWDFKKDHSILTVMNKQHTATISMKMPFTHKNEESYGFNDWKLDKFIFEDGISEKLTDIDIYDFEDAFPQDNGLIKLVIDDTHSVFHISFLRDILLPATYMHKVGLSEICGRLMIYYVSQDFEFYCNLAPALADTDNVFKIK